MGVVHRTWVRRRVVPRTTSAAACAVAARPTDATLHAKVDARQHERAAGAVVDPDAAGSTRVAVTAITTGLTVGIGHSSIGTSGTCGPITTDPSIAAADVQGPTGGTGNDERSTVLEADRAVASHASWRAGTAAGRAVNAGRTVHRQGVGT